MILIINLDLKWTIKEAKERAILNLRAEKSLNLLCPVNYS